MSHTWDPDRYLAYADERGRPFLDLLARVAGRGPRTVVDLGCGPGNLTALLADRWPRRVGDRHRQQPGDDRRGRRDRRHRAARSRTCATGRARPRLRRRRRAGLQRDPAVGARPPRPCCRAWSTGSRPGGWLAFQVPGNFDEPSHTIRAELAARGAVRRAHAATSPCRPATSPTTTSASLAGLGCAVDAWETTYLHVLTGAGPGLRLGLRHRRAPDAPGAARRPAPALRGGVQRAAARGLPRRRRTASCCRSAGSSSSRAARQSG